MKCPACKKGTPLWFISWADMATLLLCLFVILFSMSTVNATKFIKLQGTMRNAFGLNKTMQVNPVGGDTLVAMDFQQEVKLVQLIEKLELLASHLVDNGQAEVKETDSGIYLKLAKKFLFLPNSLEINPESKLQLSQIATLLQGLRNEIEVIGLPDKHPPPPLAGLLNPWAAGMVEAQAVAAFLASAGGVDPRRIKVVSYGNKVNDLPENHQDSTDLIVEIGVLKTTETRGLGDSSAPHE
ncbi:MAG: OmpA family protein [Magnetococcales bacterium]|nr:OmpA family protein [Magnetococcales bacterium]